MISIIHSRYQRSKYHFHPKILRKVRRLYHLLNVVMIPWLSDCRSEVVMLGRYWSWIFRRARKTSCGCTGALWSTRWSGLQIQFSRQPLLAPTRTTFLCLTLQPYTQGFMMTSHTNCRTQSSTGLHASQPSILNLPDEALSIHLHHYGIMPRRCSFLCRTFSMFSNSDIASLSYGSSSARINLPKTQGRELDLETLKQTVYVRAFHTARYLGNYWDRRAHEASCVSLFTKRICKRDGE